MVSIKTSYDPPPDPSRMGPGDIVRRNDPDRFFTALLARADKRDVLLTLYAFNHELARGREVTHEPMIALMRLQFWREVVQGAGKQHPVAEPLHAALESGSLEAGDLLRMIDAREAEADHRIPSLQAWDEYLLGSAGTLAVAAARALGAQAPERVRPLGAAYGAAGVLRSVPFHAAQGRSLLPADVIDPSHVTAAPEGPAAQEAIRKLAAHSCHFLQPVGVPRSALPAVLTAVLARRDLRRLPGTQARGLGDRMAVLAAWAAGRV